MHSAEYPSRPTAVPGAGASPTLDSQTTVFPFGRAMAKPCAPVTRTASAVIHSSAVVRFSATPISARIAARTPSTSREGSGRFSAPALAGGLRGGSAEVSSGVGTLLFAALLCHAMDEVVP